MQTIILSMLAVFVGLFLGWRLYAQLAASRARKAELADTLQAAIAGALDDVVMLPGQTAGVMAFEGRRAGQVIRVQTIADTLAVRKLPTWWLSVTIHGSVETDTTLDVMMRPDMPASFSNFHLRPHAIRPPRGLPELCAVRADRADAGNLLDVVAANAGLFADRRLKEMLISPHGVRLVWLMAEADRVRYGVFRQADFGGQIPTPALIALMADRVIGIRGAINTRKEMAA